MHRQNVKSRSFIDKLSDRLSDPLNEEFDLLINSNPLTRFDSLSEFKNYLTEGALLNINKLSSKALSVPCGDYIVWTTDVGHTMLVPIKQPDTEVFESKGDDGYEVYTNKLINTWNTLEKTLSEEYGEDESDSESDNKSKNKPPKSKIDASTVDRTPIMRAMEDRGYTVTALARECGVDPPAISRILREPEETAGGDPGGRNPSMGLAAQICNKLRIDPTAAFPDIFGTKLKYEPRQTPGNRGSGMKNAAHGSRKKGKASQSYTKGNS